MTETERGLAAKSANAVKVALVPTEVPRSSAPRTERAYTRTPLAYRPLRLVGKDILDTAAATGRLETFGAAIRAAGLEALLGGFGPLTVFAPTDEAFAKMPKTELTALLENRTELARVLSYHVVGEYVKAPGAGSVTTATAIRGGTLRIIGDHDGYRVNGSKVVKTNLLASNGVIHAIDTVLMPRWSGSRPRLPTA